MENGLHSAEQERALANRQAALARRTRLGVWTKSAYGAGAMVDGLASCAINLYLFFYLTAVCGLSGVLTGVSLCVALVADAVADPLVGSLSDNLHARWGRRHPFMAWSAPLIAVALTLLFCLPAGLPEAAAFAYVTAFSIVLRTALSGFNVPHFALGAELTDDHAERSNLVSYRLFLGTVGSIVCMAMGPLIFFRGASGLVHRAAYPKFAATCAGLVVIAAVVSICGTLGQRNRLHQTQRQTGHPLRQFVEGLSELFRNPTFVSLFAMEFLYFVAMGVSATLTLHASIYFWGLPQSFAQTLIVAGCFGTPIGVWLGRTTASRLEKRTTVIAGILITAFCQALLPLLKIAGLAPPLGPGLYALMAANRILIDAVVTVETIALYSMIADAADEHEHRFGARREGLYFSGLSFAIKASSGMGSLVSGIALDRIGFPAGVAKGAAIHAIPAPVLLKLGLVYGPGVAVVVALSAAALLGYRLNRRAHIQILGELDARRGIVALSSAPEI
jgi:glycoside/pentoside/hexuronide:cation symporter, GPH family